MAGDPDDDIPDVSASDADFEADEESDKTKLTGLATLAATAPVGGRDYPCLIVVAGPGVGETYRLQGEEAVVGRGEKAPFRIVDDGVSRAHARLFRRGDTLFVEDLKSANGTFVNGSRITTRALEDGDKISVGSSTILKFTYHDNIDAAFQQRMYEAALRDGLTKVFNKRYLVDRLTAELAYALRHKSELALIMLDIDHFKRVNDAYGHQGGDAVLVKVANALLGTLRCEDILARYGGEEFAVVCRNTPIESASALAERLRQRVQDTPVQWNGERLSVTISLGVSSSVSAATHSIETLFAAADGALYAAKHGGRNRVCLG